MNNKFILQNLENNETKEYKSLREISKERCLNLNKERCLNLNTRKEP